MGYRETHIKKGDEGSDLLRKLCLPTLENNGYVRYAERGEVNLPGLKIPEDHYCVVHSAIGYPRRGAEIKSLGEMANSLVDNLFEQAIRESLKPIAFTNIIDSSSGDTNVLKDIAGTLVRRSNQHSLAILNGENAILGNRVVGYANVSGTMISMIPKSGRICGELVQRGIYAGHDGTKYAVFDPEGKFIYANCDGIGTKTEFYERMQNWSLGIDDFLAMVLDDKAKMGAITQVVSGVIERTHMGCINNPEGDLMSQRCQDMGFLGTLQSAIVNSIRSYKKGVPAFNIGGTAVSVIDEDRLKNLPRPGENELLVAIRGKPNPRSNGITAKREAMVRLFGEEWHKTSEGKMFLEYLATPSTILAPVFDELLSKGIATSVFHMSGGAYDGKLARPLAEHGLFVKLENLFETDWRELAIAGQTLMTPEDCYSTCSMTTDGFALVLDSKRIREVVERHGLECRNMAMTERRADGKTGVEIEVLGNPKRIVYFSGKEKKKED
ncbi:hypothetical protein GOV12_02440 [Candidatus Pacearchaeota archaeon]|nr:hypothetical protein [Candidatus Pacearchaeota archaeon]